MKKLSIIISIAMMYCHIGSSQDPVVISNLSNTSITKHDEDVVVSTIGEPFGGIYQLGDIAVSFEPFLPWLFQRTTGIRNLLRLEGLEIYPNPATEYVVLQREELGETFTTELFSYDGTHLSSQQWQAGADQMKYPLTKLTPGIYLLIITNEAKTHRSAYRVVKR